MSDIFGWHAVIAALENKETKINRLYIASSRSNDARLKKVHALAKRAGIAIDMMTRESMDQRWGTSHQGIAAESYDSPIAETYSEEDLEGLLVHEKNALILILDGVQDPHNLGACMRSAGAAKVTCLITPKDRSASLTPAARKVACGAAEWVPFIQVTNLARTMKILQSLGVWIYGFDQHAEKILYDIAFSGKVALVMGSEEQGMRRLTTETCDELVKIPMYAPLESLNVSVAAGIALFEVRRQQYSRN